MQKITRLTISVCLAGIIVSTSRAQTATFTVDPTGSPIAVTGTAFGETIQQQGPGSLTTTYAGSIKLMLSPTTIHFPGGSAATANNSGNWQPAVGGIAGSAPANYGGRVTVLFTTAFAAVRGTVIDGTTSDPLALPGTGNSRTFAPLLNFQALAGTIDYNSVLTGPGSSPVTSDQAFNTTPDLATLSIVAETGGNAAATLVVPVEFTLTTEISGGEGVFNFDGTVTARGTARPGDTNFDGVVNLDDFNALASAFNQSGQSWLSGDFTFDGNVGLDDFNLLAGNFNTSAGADGTVDPEDWRTLAAAIPEPSLLLGVPALAGMRARRRRDSRSFHGRVGNG